MYGGSSQERANIDDPNSEEEEVQPIRGGLVKLVLLKSFIAQLLALYLNVW